MRLVREARVVEFWGPVGHAVKVSLPGGVSGRLTHCACVCVRVRSGNVLGKAVRPVRQVG